MCDLNCHRKSTFVLCKNISNTFEEIRKPEIGNSLRSFILPMTPIVMHSLILCDIHMVITQSPNEFEEKQTRDGLNMVLAQLCT